CAPSLPVSYYKTILGEKANVRLVLNRTYQLLQLSSAAVVTSGTATLETALLDVPEVVCYKANQISYLIARQVARVKYICLVNLIMDRLVVKELIQGDMTANNIRDELQSLLNSSKRQKKLLEEYEELKYVLGNAGASDRAAETIISYVKKN
ncbi:MAG: lipid-A-disaccharide synthase, partial [Paludibacteraceae bacterium]|nr:lipid-A-disaccharide synthase [Paludibacteraceae bacterium]